jgi:hypothetical protein
MSKLRYLPLLGLMLWACGPGADTTKPTVSLTPSSSTITAAGNLTLSATASDNVGVTKVEFLDGSTVLGEDTTAPYSTVVPITAANNGTKSYTARAHDAAKNIGTSPAVAVTVNIDNTPPTVSLSSDKTSLETAGDITLTATASDNLGVAKVEFFDGSTKLGEDSTAPYTQVVSLSVGTNTQKSYTARATDAAGNSANSAAVLVTVGICPNPGLLDDPTCKLDINFKLAP